jgi:C4-dicarboxylate transporter DctM subunit
MVVNLSIGFLTPPLGTNLFVACNIRNLSLEEISIGVLPFVITMIIVLMLLTYIPGISLTLPRLFMN